jgi:hypothetical protein
MADNGEATTPILAAQRPSRDSLDCAIICSLAHSREQRDRCTDAGRPFGDERFVKEIGRQWTRGHPKKEGRPAEDLAFMPTAAEPPFAFTFTSPRN